MRTLTQIKQSNAEIQSAISYKWQKFQQEMEPLYKELRLLEEEEAHCIEKILSFFDNKMQTSFSDLINSLKFLRKDSSSEEEGLTNINYYFAFKNNDKIFGLEGEYNSWSEKISFFHGIKLEKYNSLQNGSVIPRQDLELIDSSFYSLIKGLDKDELKISYLLARIEKNKYER